MYSFATYSIESSIRIRVWCSGWIFVK